MIRLVFLFLMIATSVYGREINKTNLIEIEITKEITTYITNNVSLTNYTTVDVSNFITITNFEKIIITNYIDITNTITISNIYNINKKMAIMLGYEYPFGIMIGGQVNLPFDFTAGVVSHVPIFGNSFGIGLFISYYAW